MRILMALYSFIPAIIGLIALSAFPNINPNNAMATVAIELTPPWMAGIVLAAVMSATLSSASGDFLGGATVFTKDILQKYVNPNLQKKDIVKFKKRVVLISGLIGKGFRSLRRQSSICLYLPLQCAQRAFAAFVLGLYYKNATKNAGLASVVIGSVVGAYWQYINEPYGILAVIAGSLAGTVVFFLVSWVERAMNKPAAPLVIPQG